MRKIASNLLLKEHAERVFFLCKQPDGYRIIKEIDGDYGQQILTHYQNGYGILLSEHGNLLDSIEYVMEHRTGKTCFEILDSNYNAKKKMLKDSRGFLNRIGMPICEIEDSKETYSELNEFIQENELDAFILCYFEKKGKKMSKSKYQENLIKTVMNKSWGNTWEEAVQEWDIIDCAEDNSLSRSCICGKEQIKYLYRLHNRKTNQWLFPIGSSCIKKFQRKDLQEKTATTEAMFKLLHAVGNNQYLQLSSDLFSRKLLKELYDQGAFKATSYNHYNPKNDYDFLLKMFNKRAKNSISTLQQKKITAILLNSIKPFLEQKLRSQIMS